MPGLENVIVYFEGEVSIQPTLQEALAAIFGESPPTLRGARRPARIPVRSRNRRGHGHEQVAALLTRGLRAVRRGRRRAPRRATSAPTPRRPRRPAALVDQAERLLEDAGDVPTDESTTTTTTDGASA